jgi:hypothetical protein
MEKLNKKNFKLLLVDSMLSETHKQSFYPMESSGTDVVDSNRCRTLVDRRIVDNLHGTTPIMQEIHQIHYKITKLFIRKLLQICKFTAKINGIMKGSFKLDDYTSVEDILHFTKFMVSN